MDRIEGTYVWVRMAEAFPKTLVHLYHGLIRIFYNNTASLLGSLAGSLALIDDTVKEQMEEFLLFHDSQGCRRLTWRRQRYWRTEDW
jgi:hypothetical protein